MLQPFTANQALQLLWAHQFDLTVNLALTDEEITHLKGELIFNFSKLTSPYVKHLVSVDKQEVITLMANGDNIFNNI